MIFATQIDEKTTFTDVAVACGSGATAAGVALGLRLGGSKVRTEGRLPDYYLHTPKCTLSGCQCSPSCVGQSPCIWCV